ncbi:MAG: dynamin family protein [Clostridium sp.]|nr:dynamin family protein [Clostridium sp.]
MGERRFLIMANPYTQKIKYQFTGEDGEWADVAEESRLNSEAFTNTTIQREAVKIVREINSTYNMGNRGLEIEFNGTDEDYQYLSEIIEKRFKNDSIICNKGERQLFSATDVLPEIESVYDSVESIFEQNPNSHAQEELNKFSDARKAIVPICVMGLYSAGKSAFINSLIGDEILPSSSEPTTARNYCITSSNSAKIRFNYQMTEKTIPVEITFDGAQYKINQIGELAIVKRIDDALKDDSIQHSQSYHMNRTLQIINEQGKDEGISDPIEVQVPFTKSKLPLDDFNFSIYDTPGSDSNNKEHLEKLKKILGEQTNGLPIFVTDPDSTDKESNNSIINLIENVGEGLDRTNTLIVINKSDVKDRDTLEKIKKNKENNRITEWKDSKIFFVSGIMGLGSKKNNPGKKTDWIDSGYAKVYHDHRENFAEIDSDYYVRLYDYNIGDEYRIDDSNLSERDRVYYNSGIASVEHEITRFAEKHSLYNKCFQANKYLKIAIQILDEELKDTQQEKEKKERELTEKLDAEKQKLVKKLQDESDELAKKIETEYTDKIERVLSRVYDKNIISLEIKHLWGDTKTNEKNKSGQIQEIEKRVNWNFEITRDKILRESWEESNEFWKEKTRFFKDECIKIVTGSTALTPQQKEAVCMYILNAVYVTPPAVKLDLRLNKVIRNKRIMLFKVGEIFDEKKCIKEFDNKISLIKAYVAQQSKDKNHENFNKWRNDLQTGIRKQLAALNPELNLLNEQLEECKNKVEILKIHHITLEEKSETLDKLLSFGEM